jgi:hypothetical protein
MIGVTAFGLFLTPVFYVLLRALTGNRPLKQHGEIPHDVEAPGVTCRPSTATVAAVAASACSRCWPRRVTQDE